MTLHELWKLIEVDLQRARDTLPQSAQSADALRWYQEYMENNELELASDMLALYGQDHAVSKEFWVALHEAAKKMGLPNQANRYEECAKSL